MRSRGIASSQTMEEEEDERSENDNSLAIIICDSGSSQETEAIKDNHKTTAKMTSQSHKSESMTEEEEDHAIEICWLIRANQSFDVGKISKGKSREKKGNIKREKLEESNQ